jgi:formaldehyde-activating enzyme involved in methanogenesis
MIVKATVHPRALDRHQLFANVRRAMYRAIKMAYGKVRSELKAYQEAT